MPIRRRKPSDNVTYLNALHAKKGRLAVYLLRDGTAHIFKIGVSDDPTRRAKQLVAASGRRALQLVRCAWLSGEEAVSLEARILSTFKRHIMVGEWLSIDHYRIFDVFDDVIAALPQESGVEVKPDRPKFRYRKTPRKVKVQ